MSMHKRKKTILPEQEFPEKKCVLIGIVIGVSLGLLLGVTCVACHAKRKKLTRKTKKTLLNTTFKSVFYYL